MRLPVFRIAKLPTNQQDAEVAAFDATELAARIGIAAGAFVRPVPGRAQRRHLGGSERFELVAGDSSEA